MNLIPVIITTMIVAPLFYWIGHECANRRALKIIDQLQKSSQSLDESVQQNQQTKPKE